MGTQPQVESDQQKAMRKAALLQAAGQLDMLVTAFANAPERIKTAAKEFKDALEEWANG